MVAPANDTPLIEPSAYAGYWVNAAGEAHPIPRSQKGHFWANAMELWMGEAERAYGFTSRIYDTPDGRDRVIELLGPDSPGEYVKTFPKWRLGDTYLEELCIETILWADRMGKELTGEYAPGVVPDRHRTT